MFVADGKCFPSACDNYFPRVRSHSIKPSSLFHCGIAGVSLIGFAFSRASRLSVVSARAYISVVVTLL